MDKQKLKLLEKAFAAEIDSALNKHQVGIMQSNSKLATELVESGYLQESYVKLGGRFPVTITGFSLTEMGRITYCESCRDQ